MKKTRSKKSRDTVPLKKALNNIPLSISLDGLLPYPLGEEIVPPHLAHLGIAEREKFTDVVCSARDWERSGLLEGIPRVVVQISALL